MKFHKVIRTDLFKDMGFLMGGTLIAQLIPILLQPILKRLFTPEDFGAFDIYFRSVGLLAVIFTLRYEKAIVLCKKKIDAISIYLGIILSSFVMLVITEILLVLLSHGGLSLGDFPSKYSKFIFLVPVSALFFALTSASQFFFIREKRFFASSSLKIYRRGSEGLVQTGSGIIGNFWGLPIGDTIGNATSAVIGFLRIKRNFRTKSRKQLIRSIKENAIKYSDFPKYALLSNLLNMFVLSALTFQVYAKFSLEEVGYLELTQKILTIPSALIGIAIGQIVLQRFSSAFNKQRKVLRTFFGLLSFSLALAIPFLLIIYFWGPSLFKWVFGPTWEISGLYAKSLILSTCCFFIISPLGQALIAIQKIKRNAIWEYFKFILVGSLFLIRFQNIEQYLKSYNIILIIVYLGYLILILYNLLEYEKKID